MLEKTILHENCCHPITIAAPIKCQCPDISRSVYNSNQIHSLCETLPTIFDKRNAGNSNRKDIFNNEDKEQVDQNVKNKNLQNQKERTINALENQIHIQPKPQETPEDNPESKTGVPDINSEPKINIPEINPEFKIEDPNKIEIFQIKFSPKAQSKIELVKTNQIREFITQKIPTIDTNSNNNEYIQKNTDQQLPTNNYIIQNGNEPRPEYIAKNLRLMSAIANQNVGIQRNNNTNSFF